MQTSFTINTFILTFPSESQLNRPLVGGWASMAAHPQWWPRGNGKSFHNPLRCNYIIKILDQAIKTCRCGFHQSLITNRRRWFSQTKGSLIYHHSIDLELRKVFIWVSSLVSKWNFFLGRISSNEKIVERRMCCFQSQQQLRILLKWYLPSRNN